MGGDAQLTKVHSDDTKYKEQTVCSLCYKYVQIMYDGHKLSPKRMRAHV